MGTDRAGRVAAHELIPFVREVAEAAGRLTLGHFRSADLRVDTKTDGTPVTEADQGSERLIREAIAAEFPGDSILGEEYGETVAASGRQWVIDPIDGTKAFTAGVPLYSNLIAVIDDGVPVVGVINLPALSEMVWAAAGHGAFCNGEACRVSTKSELRGAYVMTSSVRYWPEEYLQAVLDEDMILRTWGDAYGYAMVATGRAEAMIDPRVSVWDIAPVGVIVSEAGGRFTDLISPPATSSGARHLTKTVDNWDGVSGLGTNGVLHDRLRARFPSEGWR